jgi:putative endonuclease
MNRYYVYVLTNRTRRLYVGMTNNLLRRVYQHKNKQLPGFTATYNISWLVYFEETPDAHAAIAREKQIKAWGRAKKTALVETMNPEWKDLSADWYGPRI